MKRFLSAVLCLVMLTAALPAWAETAANPQAPVRQRVTDFFLGVADWVSDIAEDTQQAARDAGDWARNAWQSTKDGARDAWDWAKGTWDKLWQQGGEKMRAVGSWFSEKWQAIKDFFVRLIGNLTLRLAGVDMTMEEMEQLFERLGQLMVQDVAAEAADYTEELFLQKGIPVPEEIGAFIRGMRELSASMEAPQDASSLDIQPLYDYLPQLGLTQEEYTDTLTKRGGGRFAAHLLDAMKTVLNEMAAEKGVTVPAEVNDALDELALSLRDGHLEAMDESSPVNSIVTKWCQENKIDAGELLRRVIHRMEQPQV